MSFHRAIYKPVILYTLRAENCVMSPSGHAKEKRNQDPNFTKSIIFNMFSIIHAKEAFRISYFFKDFFCLP